MTDVKKTLEILRNAGASGVHSFDLNRLVGTTRSAARIDDLKKLGYVITSKPEKMGDSRGVRYYLFENKKKVEAETVKPGLRLIFEGNTARWVKDGQQEILV